MLDLFDRIPAPAFARYPNIFGVLVFLLAILNIEAQYRVDTWTTDNGLPQNSVTGLTQTPDEYLWFTTNDGLVRFDGVRFTVYNKSNTPQISSNRLSSAFADRQGRLWFHAEDGAVLYYQNGVFTLVAKPGELPSGTRSRFFDPADGVVFNIDGRPFKFQGERFSQLTIDGRAVQDPLILSGAEGELWFSESDGVSVIKNGSRQHHSLAAFQIGREYQVAYDDRRGGLWLGSFATNDHRHSLHRIRNGKVQQIPLPGESVNEIEEDAQGNLWLSILNIGIYRIDRTAVVAEEVPADALKPVITIDGISRNASGRLNFDREGGLWVGTEKGLHRVSPQMVEILSREDGLREDNVYPIYCDKKGTMWLGIWPNSLVRYDGREFVTSISHETVFVTSLFEDASARLWFGTLGNLFYLQNEKPIRFTEQAGFQIETEFSAITETPDHALWFGTSRGLARYVSREATLFSVKDGLPDDYVVALLPARDGKLWIGTRGGLASFENGNFRSYTVADGLGSNYIRSLYEDADGVLWIGSYDGGLTRLKDGRFTAYTTRDGLSSNGVFCILEDDAGWLWINSNQGIYRVSRHELNDFAEGGTRSLNSISYNKKDGLLNVEGNGGRQPAGIKTADGRLWFPTAEGVAVVDPKAVAINKIPPPVRIEEVMIDRSAVSNDTFQAAVNHRSGIEVDPGQNNLEINYTALSFVNSEQLKFKYKLENLDADWNEVGTRRTAYYSYVPPGEYVFRVIAANRDGVWNPEGATIALTVHPAFYQTWYFTLLLSLSVIAAIAFVYYLRVRQLRLKSEQQEAFARQLIASQERERGRIAAEMHDGLGQSLAIIKNRAMITLLKPDDQDHALEQMREIAEASTEAIDEVHEIIYDLRPIQLDRLGLTGALEDMAERIAKIEDIELSMSVDNVDNVLAKHSENSLYRMVQECLSNVVKHSHATRLEFVLRSDASVVRLMIKDNGKGFTPDKAEQISEHGGFGLFGMAERAKLLGGQTIVESGPGVGTTVSITVPVDKTDR